MNHARTAVVVGAWGFGVVLGCTAGLVLWAVDRANRRPLITGNFDRHPFDWPPETDGEPGGIFSRCPNGVPHVWFPRDSATDECAGCDAMRHHLSPPPRSAP